MKTWAYIDPPGAGTPSGVGTILSNRPSHPKRSSDSGLSRESIDVAAGTRVFDASLSAGGLGVTSVCHLAALRAASANGLLLVLHPTED
jgi:hypothetical protein